MLPLFVLLVGVGLADDEDGSDEGGGDDDWGEGDDDGWGDEGDEAGFGDDDAPPPEVKKARWWRLGGTVQTDEAWWLNEREGPALARARQTLDLELSASRGPWRAMIEGHGEVDLAILGQEQWDDPTREAHGLLLQPRQVWMSFAAGPLETTVGRQVVAWGEGRLVSVVDVANPKDMRDPGMVDLEDLRLPVTMARASLSVPAGATGSHTFELASILESSFGMRSPPLGPYGSLPGLIESGGLPPDMAALIDMDEVFSSLDVDYRHLQDRWDPAHTGTLGRWTWRGSGVDLSLMGASVLDPQGVFVLPELTEILAASNEGGALTIDIDHRRMKMVGHSGVAQTPGALVRWEVAYKPDMPVNVGQIIDTSTLIPALDLRIDETALVQGVVGLSWSGWGGATLDIDLSKGFLIDPPADLIFPIDAPQWGLRAAKPLLRERLMLDASVLSWGWFGDYGALARVGASYEIANALYASAGAIAYWPGSERGPLMGFDQHDRVFTGLRWDF